MCPHSRGFYYETLVLKSNPFSWSLIRYVDWNERATGNRHRYEKKKQKPTRIKRDETIFRQKYGEFYGTFAEFRVTSLFVRRIYTLIN